MKRPTTLFAILIVLTLVIGACTPPSTPTPAPTEAPAGEATQAPAAEATEPEAAGEVTEIHLFHQYTEGGGSQPLLVQLTEEYEAEHPEVDIIWEWAGWEQYDQKLAAHVEAGDPLDILWSSASKISIFAQEGILLPLDDYLAGQDYEGDGTWMDSFFPSLMEQSYVENAAEGAGYYGAPEGMYTSGIFYNVDLFEAQGLQPPTTWAELIETAEALKAAGITPFAHDGGYAPYNARAFMYVASRVCGEDAFYETSMGMPGTSWTDNPCWLTAAQETQTLFGYFQEGFLGSQWPAAQVEFSQGKAGMMIIPDWLPSELVGTAPDDFHMAVVRFPSYEGGLGDQTASELKYNGFALMRDAPEPEAAIEFMKFLTSRRAAEDQAEQFLITPAVVGATVPDSLAGSADIIANSKTMRFVAGVEEDATEWSDTILQPLLAELATGLPPADFVEDLQAQSTDYYADN